MKTIKKKSVAVRAGRSGSQRTFIQITVYATVMVDTHHYTLV